jgi:ubiquinone biosynthesis monooxygenase Coq7
MPKPYFNNIYDYNIAEILRVNHAGETAAKVIYEAQLKNLAKSKIGELLKEMRDQESGHLIFYEESLKQYNINPSILLPLWKVLSNILGSVTSFNPKLAMICTKAVEDVIDEHYQQQYNQIKTFKDYDEELLNKIAEHLADEIHHKQIALDYLGGREYPCSEFVIRASCRLAIYLSKIL